MVVGLLLLLALGGKPRKRGPSTPSAQRTTTDRATQAQADRGPRSWRGGAPRPTGPSTLADLVDRADDPDSAAPDSAAIEPGETGPDGLPADAARRAMADRDLAAARVHADAAIGQAATDAELHEARRVGALLDALEGFWDAVEKEALRLQSGQDIPLGDTRVMIVEANEGTLLVHWAGQLRQFTVDDIPAVLAVTLADRRLLSGHPGTNLRLGAFWAIDAKGDREKARHCWEAAGDEGRGLMPELDVSPPVLPSDTQLADAGDPPPDFPTEPPDRPLPPDPLPPAPESPKEPTDADPQPPQPPPPPEGQTPPVKPPEPQPPAVDERLPVPSTVEQSLAEELIRLRFADDFAGDPDAEDRAELAQKLAAAAGEAEGDSTKRFTLYRMALDMVTDLGDTGSIYSLVDQMARIYQIDPLDMKAKSLLTAWRSEDAAGNRGVILRRSQEILETAIQSENHLAAHRAIRVAISGAKNAKDYRTARQLEEQAREIQAKLRAKAAEQ